MKIADIKKAYMEGKNIPAKFAGEAIAKDHEMLFSYLMDNNPEAINYALKFELGHKELPIVPDRKAMGGLIHLMFLKNDKVAIQKVIDTFTRFGFNEKANNYTTGKELRQEIIKHL